MLTKVRTAERQRGVRASGVLHRCVERPAGPHSRFPFAVRGHAGVRALGQGTSLGRCVDVCHLSGEACVKLEGDLPSVMLCP